MREREERIGSEFLSVFKEDAEDHFLGMEVCRDYAAFGMVADFRRELGSRVVAVGWRLDGDHRLAEQETLTTGPGAQ